MKSSFKTQLKRVMLLFMTLALMASSLTGCSVYSKLTRFDVASQEKDDPGEVDVKEEEENRGGADGTAADAKSGSPFEDNLFTLNYNSAEPLNPYTCTNRFNLMVGELVYESLFTYDAEFNIHPVLAQTWSTTDGRVWKITIKSGVYFHDGKELNANDIMYSLRQSNSNQGTYTGRITSDFVVDISPKGNYELTITLGYANWDFLKLLDVPIIESGSANLKNPAGTGPYAYTTQTNPLTGESTVYLNKWEQYRHADELSLDTIYLREYSDGNLASAFSDGYIDILEFDPSGVAAVSVQMDHETRYYNTTILEYLGFNYQNSILKSETIRRAIGHAVNYDYIVNTILNGKALASPLILSPAVDVYDAAWEETLGAGYDLVAFSQGFAEYGMADSDNDGYLECPSGGMKDFTFTLLVNNDNTYRIAVAERIAATLRSVGVSVEVNACSYENYVYNLRHGNFDMYIAEVRLTADFNPTELLRKWGSMNFGLITEKSDQDDSYVQLSRRFLAAATTTEISGSDKAQEIKGEDGQLTLSNAGANVENEAETVYDFTARTVAASDLCTYVYNTAPIIPICYKQMAVVTHRNVIYNLQPSQSSLFRNFTECTITLD